MIFGEYVAVSLVLLNVLGLSVVVLGYLVCWLSLLLYGGRDVLDFDVAEVREVFGWAIGVLDGMQKRCVDQQGAAETGARTGDAVCVRSTGDDAL